MDGNALLAQLASSMAAAREKFNLMGGPRWTNSSSPIASLPVEMLIAIFLECARVDRSVAPYGIWRTKYVVVTQVCRHWRAVALATPALWSAIVIDSETPQKKLERWLERSGQELLSVTLVRRSALFGRIMEEYSRIWHLDLSLGPRSLALLGWPQGPSPLKHLRVRNVSHDLSMQILEGDYRKTFWDMLRDSKRFPVLEVLVAEDCNLGFRDLILPPTLTCLEVVNWRGCPSRYHLMEVLETLRPLRSLRSLRFKNSLSILSFSTSVNVPPVSLPVLESIRLYEDPPAYAMLLGSLEVAPSVRLDLELDLDSGHFDRLAIAMHSFSLRLNLPSQSQSAYVCLKDDDGTRYTASFSFKWWRQNPSMELIQNVNRAKADIDIKMTDRSTRYDSEGLKLLHVQNLLVASPLSHINSLYIDCRDNLLWDAPDVYGKMTQLHTLTLIGRGDHFDSAAKLADMLEQHPTIFPELRVFHAEGADLLGTLRRYCDILRRRQRHPGESKVFIRECRNISQPDIDGLGEDVLVDWDGYSGHESDTKDGGSESYVRVPAPS